MGCHEGGGAGCKNNALGREHEDMIDARSSNASASAKPNFTWFKVNVLCYVANFSGQVLPESGTTLS